MKKRMIPFKGDKYSWHEPIKNPTLADAGLDRVIHNAYKIELKCESMMKNGKMLI